MVIHGASAMKSRPLAMMLPKVGRRRRRAHADERQRRLGQDGGREHVGEPHDQRPGDVRQHVPPQHPQLRHPDRPRRLHEVQRPHAQHGRPHDPRRVRRGRDRERDDDVGDGGAEHGGHRDRQQDGRKRHQRVHQPHDRVVQPREEPGGRADHRAAEAGQGRRAQADDERGAGAEQHAGQNVAAEMVGAEPVHRVRRPQPLPHGASQRIVRREHAGEHRDHRNEQHQGSPEQERPVAKQQARAAAHSSRILGSATA